MIQIGAKTQRFRCGNIETIIMSDLKKIKLTIPTKVHGEIRFHGLRVPLRKANGSGQTKMLAGGEPMFSIIRWSDFVKAIRTERQVL